MRRTIRLPLALALVAAGAASVASRFLPGTVIGWQVLLDSRAGRTLPFVLVLLVAGLALFLATRRRPKARRSPYPASTHLFQARRHRALRAAVFGAADSASAAGGPGLRRLVDWPISVAKIILLVGALGLVLRLMHFCESFAAAGGARGGAPAGVDFPGWSLYPLAAALAAVVPIVVLSLVVRRRAEVALAEVRAVARRLTARAGGRKR